MEHAAWTCSLMWCCQALSTPSLPGIRTALGGGWMWLLRPMACRMRGAREGIGFLIMQGSSANDLTLAIVGMVMIGAFGALLHMDSTS